MGLINRFVCEKCFYTAEVSGGRDYGGISHVQTMSCERCRKLVDVVVATDRPESARKPQIGRCPGCDQRDRLTLWGDDEADTELAGAEPSPTSGPCPQCGGLMRFHDSIGTWDG